MAIRKATEAQWRAIGTQTKHCRQELIKLCNMAGPYMPIRVTDRLLKQVLGHLDKFRSEAENEMFNRGGPDDLSIFYGD